MPASTVIANAGSERVLVPSLTEITMLDWAPTFAVFGVPKRRPVAALKDAQVGLFATENVILSRSASVAVGVKLYCVPATTEVGGVPLKLGVVPEAWAVAKNARPARMRAVAAADMD